MRKIILALVLLYSGSAWAQVGQIATWPPKAIVIGGGAGSCSTATNTEVQTWGTNVDRQGGAVSPTQCGNVDTLITSLKTAVGTPLSSNISRLWLATSADTTAGDIAAQFKVDLIHGDLLDFTSANIGARLDHLTGYTPNGTSEYIKTSFIPSSSDTGVFGLNAASMGAYIVSSGAGTANAIIVGSYDGSLVDQIATKLGGGTYDNVFINSLTPSSISGPTTVFGLQLGIRGGATVAARMYQSATPTTSSAGSVVSGLSTVALYINAQNDNGTAASFDPDGTGAVILGRAFSDPESDNVAAALNTYMTSVGAAHW